MQVMEPAIRPAPVVHPRMSREDIDSKFHSHFKSLKVEELTFNQLEEQSLKHLYNESQVVHTLFADQNRYLNVYPNDNHRATLLDGGYLNITPIYLGEKTYFVGQAPTHYSLYSFLQFLLEPLPEKKKGIQTIVALTMPKEGNRETCYNYWENCASIKVLKEEVVFTQSTVRVVHRLLALYKNNKAVKEVNQVAVENWPDGAIISIECLYAVIEIVRKLKGGKFIHCSAGLGRTGVFLVAYHALRDMDYEHINENILRCRIQRRGMIQTATQHRYLAADVRKLISNLKQSPS